jgi:ketosteroid isomerase-like protein
MNKLLAAAITSLLFSAALADTAADVRCREIGFSKSVEQQDLSAFASFVDSDARFVGTQVLRGSDEVTEAWSVFFAEEGPTIKWRPQIIEVLKDGKLALSRGPYHTTYEDAEGNTVESWGTFNSVWRLNEDGVWRVVFDAGSPAAGEPTDEMKAILSAEDDC